MSSKLSAPVLVLNANFEPLNVCSTRRALGLMIKNKASLVLNGRGYIHGVSSNFPAPTIIRLSYMIKRPRPVVNLSKSEIFRRDQYTCQYCGTKGNPLTIDHVLPKSKGGKHVWENLVTACETCNLKKGDKKIENINMNLIKMPKAPSPSAMYIFSKFTQQFDEWVPYINGW